MRLPADHRPYTDKYFLRSKEVLEHDERNPRIKAQVFIRKGHAKIYGLSDAMDILTTYGDHDTLRVYALKEGDTFAPCECVMEIHGRARNLIELETMCLGIISARTTIENDHKDINLTDVRRNMGRIVDLVRGRPVSYFGARHWSWDRDAEISRECYNAGAANCSTDIGAMEMGGQQGIGTIPHALQAVYHQLFGIDKAVVESMVAFDNAISEEIPRIALIDYANREIEDSINVAGVLQDLGNKRLDAIRIDTCGENVIQGAMHMLDESFWFGNGVCINGVHNIRKALDYSGFDYVKIILSSGFGNPEKVKAFVDAEKILKTRLFDGLGVGGVFYSRMATMDIVSVDGVPTSKVGRTRKPTDRLMRVI
jgi:nicotinate phosphoribosyltransferase